MTVLTHEDLASKMAQLYEPFDLADHEIREGPSTPKKVRWFVYIRREAIQRRLDAVFPLQASIGFSNPLEPYRVGKTGIECAMYIEINGVRREFNGVQEGSDVNAYKGAATDALKRVASLWGMGLYLQSSPDLMTNKYKDEKGNIDWTKKTNYEIEAKRAFASWYNSSLNNMKASA